MNRTPNASQDPRAPVLAVGASRPRRRARGFTLIEIIVALSAGLLVSIAAFSMSKNATAFFQHETRISSAQLALTLGMNRLTADIQRASFQSTPNAKADPMVCGYNLWGTAAGLQSLAGITIRHAPLVGGSQNAGNVPAVTPDQVIIGGSLNSSESYGVRAVSPGAGAPLLQLQPATEDGAIARLQGALGAGETLQAKLALIFVPGRFVNIFDPATGFHVYAVIGAPPVVLGGIPSVQLSSAVSIPLRTASPCGILDPQGAPQKGLVVSVASRALYDIRSLAAVPMSQYAALVTPVAPLASGDAGRTELVRVELDYQGNELPNTLELVSEYTVDMRFGLTVSTVISNDNYAPSVITYPIGDANVYLVAGDVAANTATPQLIRAVQVRLATRTRAPDRTTDLPTGTDGRRLHYLVGHGFPPGYARVRTNYANVALPNQGGFSLW